MTEKGRTPRHTMSGQIQWVLASAVQPVMRIPVGRRMVPGTKAATVSNNKRKYGKIAGGAMTSYVV